MDTLVVYRKGGDTMDYSYDYSYSGGSGADLVSVGLLAGFLLFFIVYAVIYYVFVAFCLMKIAEKTNTKDSWWAWVPLLNLVLMLKIAKLSGWWVLVFLFGALLSIIPFIGVFIAFLMVCFSVFVYYRIAEERGKNGLISLLQFIPVIGPFLVPAYLAFTE